MDLLTSRNLKVGLIGVALASVAAYSLNRGIFVGSETWIDENFSHKYCRYLFVTGVSRIPARGGMSGTFAGTPKGIEFAKNGADSLYCRMFAE